jgi:hypothetical protein
MFRLPSGNMRGEEMARIFVENRLNMGRFMKNHPPPFIARVSARGVALVYPDKPDPEPTGP